MRGKDWPSQRKVILKRDHKKCALCGSTVSSILEIHHIIPFRDCRHNAEWNLICVCTDCHNIIDAGVCNLYTPANREGQEKHYGRLKEAVKTKNLEEQIAYLVKWRKHSRQKVSKYKVMTITRYFRYCLAHGYMIRHKWNFKANGNLSIEWWMSHHNSKGDDEFEGN